MTFRIALVVALLLAAPSPAAAFHTGSTFDAAPGAGGGGGYFYTGSPREHGWDCTACHVDPPRRLRVTIGSEPPELFQSRSYEPGRSYVITVAMADPASELGRSATRSNFNGMAVTIVGDDLSPAGVLSGFDSSRFHARNTNVLASDSTQIGETSWTFTWTAPDEGTGTIGMYIAVVDGNGADAMGLSTLTDPFGDDVATGSFRLAERGATASRGPVRAPRGRRRTEPARRGVAVDGAVDVRAASAAILLVGMLVFYRPRRAQRPRR